MSFRYVNPGFTTLLSNSTGETYQNNIYNPTAFVSFSETTELDTIILPEYLTEDLYFSFNFYYTDNDPVLYFQARTIYNNYYFGVLTYGSKIYLAYSGKNNRVGEGISIKKNFLNSVWCHLKLTGTKATSYLEIKVNDTFYSKTLSELSLNARKFETNTNGIRIYSTSADIYFSNLIISNEYIDPKEQIISLPISSTESNMTFDSETGIYTATATNQSLLSAVNVNALADEYGSNSTVTGSLIVGNPAYKTAEGLSSLTAFSKDNSENVLEYGTYALGSDSAGVVADNQIFSDTKIADLQNLKFGWIAK